MPKVTTKKPLGKRKHGDAPPFNNGAGRWAKKVSGRLVYFGTLADDPEGDNARRVWREQKEAIRAGRRPILHDHEPPTGVTVKVLCDAFLAKKESMIVTGELTHRSWSDYYGTCLKIADALGRHRLVSDLAPPDFDKLRQALAGKRGLVTLKGHMVRARVLFKWGVKSEMLEHAVRYGESFELPVAEKLRGARNDKPKKFFTQPELCRILDACGVQLKAMALLGVNCGLGNADCGRLKFKHLNLKTGWLDFPRPKTSEERRGKLWRETIAAIKSAIDERPDPASEEYRDLVFLTHCGKPWYDDRNRDSPLSAEFAKVLRSLKLKQTGVSFYSLRHVTQTIGEGALDAAALRRVMGHVAPSGDMASHYREHIDDARLEAVAKYVHAWLFPPKRKLC